MTPSGAIQQQYGLADFGRRVPGLGEGNARRAYSAKPTSKLPAPDGYWPGARPWWFESTVDEYARSTGKPVPTDARWPLTWPDATGPAPLLPVTEVTVPGRGGVPATVSVLIYDTPHAPVAYVLRHDLDTVAETAAAAATTALPGTDWPTAVVIVADHRLLGDRTEYDDVEVYRLRPRRPGTPTPAPTRPGLLGRLFGEISTRDDTNAPPAVTDPEAMHAVYSGSAYADQVARVLGRPLPMWLDHTCTPAAVRQALAYGDGAPITAPETTTDWPTIRDAVHATVEHGVAERYPQAFALLAAGAVTALMALREYLADTPRTGDGWYLAAVPATPSWPVDLEYRVTTAAGTGFDADAAASELPGLRAEEADLPVDHPAGDALHEAASLLAHRLRTTHPEIAYAAPKRTALQSGGPVTTQYLAGLTRLSDEQVHALLDNPTRRIAALLTGEHHSAGLSPEIISRARQRVAALYQAPDGRYTAEFEPYDRAETDHHLAIEWPASLPTGWDDDTRIAADDSGSGPKLVVALTPHPDGGLHVDLLPNPGGEPGYTWGYQGSGPRTLYKALIRCAIGKWQHPLSSNAWISHLARHPDASALYQSITTHHGQLRLGWTTIRQHADDDLATLTHLHTQRPSKDFEPR